MAKFPHADPVAIVEIKDAIKNMTGMSACGTEPSMVAARYWPVPTWLASKLENVVAKYTIPIAGNIRLNPWAITEGK